MFIKELEELGKKGEEYLKAKELSEDDHEAGKKELARQVLGQMWSVKAARNREWERQFSWYVEDEEEEDGSTELSLDYNAIDEAIARHQHIKKHGTDANFKKEGSPSIEEPHIISEKEYGDFTLIIKDIGETNVHNLPEHIDGKIDLMDNGEGLLGSDDLKELRFHISIPKVKFRCCRPDIWIDSEPKYYNDLRSIQFTIVSKKEGYSLNGKFSLEYLSGFAEKSSSKRQIGFFAYILEIDGTIIHSIDYTGMETKEEYDRRKLVQIPEDGHLHEGSEVGKAEMHKFTGDIFGSYSPMPKSLKGEIIVQFELDKSDTVTEKPPSKSGSSASSDFPNVRIIPVEVRNLSKDYSHFLSTLNIFRIYLICPKKGFKSYLNQMKMMIFTQSKLKT